MFVHLAIHSPGPGKAVAMLESMDRFGAAMEAAGLWRRPRTSSC